MYYTLLGFQKASRDHHSGARQTAEMKPMPRPRTNKSTADSLDQTQVNDPTEKPAEDPFADHFYEDIDEVLNQRVVHRVFTIPPRNISREENVCAFIINFKYFMFLLFVIVWQQNST